jgi:hypothetical protein
MSGLFHFMLWVALPVYLWLSVWAYGQWKAGL